jgi:hypothetical protein
MIGISLELGAWDLDFFISSSDIAVTADSRRGRPRGRIADRLDNLLDCVNHQLRFLNLNIVRAFGCDFVFGIWCKCCQRTLCRMPRPVQCSRKIDWQWLPWAEVERLTLRQNKKGDRGSGFAAAAFST